MPTWSWRRASAASRAPRRRTRSSSSAASSAAARASSDCELLADRLEQRALGAPLLGERLQPERQRLRLLSEPVDLGAEVALGDPELLGARHAPLELELRALERVARLGGALLGGHDLGARQLERRPERGHAGLPRLDPAPLGRLLDSPGAPRPRPASRAPRRGGPPRSPAARPGAPCAAAPSCAWRSRERELALDLVHHVAHAQEVLAGRLELALSVSARCCLYRVMPAASSTNTRRSSGLAVRMWVSRSCSMSA